MVNEFELGLRDPVPLVTVRSLLLITALAAISVGSFIAARNGTVVWCTAGSSVILMGLGVLISLTTAYSRQIRRRKFLGITFASTVFIISASTASFIHQSEIEFRLSGDWAPMDPEVMTSPLKVICVVFALLAAGFLLYLANVSESADLGDPLMTENPGMPINE